MEFIFKKETNIEKGQKFYGIIGVSTRTHDGIHPITVYAIDWNNEEVIFKVDQPCGIVSCSFNDINEYVFETKKEAKEKLKTLEFGVGMFAHDFYR